MNDHPQRFWQIHLSTAVTLSVVAGVFMYLNLTPTCYYQVVAGAGGVGRVIWSTTVNDYGWPVPVVTSNIFHINQALYKEVWGNPLFYYDYMGDNRNDPPVLQSDGTYLDKRNLYSYGWLNVLTALVTLYTVGRLSEWLIRRRRGAKQ